MYSVDSNNFNESVGGNRLTINSLPRWLLIFSMAVTTTFGLMLLMYKLIFMAPVVVDETPPLYIEDVVWEEPENPTVIKEAPKPPEEIEPAPAKPEPPLENYKMAKVKIPGDKINIPEGGNVGFDPSMPIEQFLISPTYPRSALQRGIEGFVEIRFDVNKMGATENIVVLRADPQGYFEKAAVAAAARWRFQPKTQEGKAVHYSGLSKRLTFEIES